MVEGSSIKMKLRERIRNAISAFNTKTVTLADRELAEWLGIEGKNRGALSEITYFTCLKTLSETMGKLPIKFYQRTKDGKIRAEPNKAYQLLSLRPNRYMTPTTFWTTVEMNTQHYGNGYVWVRSKFVKEGTYGGRYEPIDMWVLPSKNVQILIDDTGLFENKGDIWYQYTDEHTSEMRIFRREEIMHFKTWYSTNGYTGEAVRDILKMTVHGASEQQNYMNNLYENGLTAKMVLQYTGDLDETRQKKLKNKYEKYLTGSKNAGKIATVPFGMQLTPLNISLADAQFFELRKYSALQIAGAFGIKPNQINNYEKSSYSNSESQNLSFLVDTMAVRIKAYEEEINNCLLTYEEYISGKYFKFNEKAILRTDSKTQMENLKSGVNNGMYTPNEARDYLDMPHVPGGDIPIVNGNYIPLTEVGKQYEKEGVQNGH